MCEKHSQRTDLRADDSRMEAGGILGDFVFLEIPTSEMAIGRVALRVSLGGHHIPEADIRRRFVSGKQNFVSIYQALVDVWRHYENLGPTPRLIASCERNASKQPCTQKPSDLLGSLSRTRR